MRIAPHQFQRWCRLSATLVAELVMSVAVGSFPGVVLAQTLSPEDSSHFTYDTGISLNAKEVSVKVRDGVTIQDITYTGFNGETVPTYFIIPKGTGKFAGVFWGHWLMPGTANSNRDEFLEEATALAPAGVIYLLIDAPQARPNFKPTTNPVVVAQQVDLRRGLDLLLSRPDVDTG
jgi:hypothetical protein